MNLEQYIGAITAFDSIISDNIDGSNEIPSESSSGSILSDLFKYYTGSKLEEYKRTFPKYIYQTFNTFRKHKQKIKIDMDFINDYLHDKILLNLLFDNVVRDEDGSWIEVDNKQNVLKSDVLELLQNVNRIEIDYAWNYPFSLLQFLSNIENTSVTKVSIWIGSKGVFELKSSTYFDKIRNDYKAKQFEIKLEYYQYVYIDKC